MAKTLPIPRKRRTRAHVIASQSINFVERFICDAGFTAERMREDYGFDLQLHTYDADGYIEPGRVLFQLKASDNMKATSTGEYFLFSLSVEDFNLWVHEQTPVFFVLYDAGNRRGYWVHIQRYFAENPERWPRPGASTVRILVPRKNRFGAATIRLARQRNAENEGFVI